MAKDYVVRFSGEDNLSSTINKIKSELKDFGGDALTISNKVELIDRALNNSNYKRALKEILNVLVTMERLGQGSSATAVHLRELGASIVDMVGDARQELRLMSSDTANFDAAIEGFNLIASTASIATGAMALFGDENQNVAEAIAKVQGAMGILQGVQEVSNMLNKDSILMLLLKSKWQAIKEAATIKDTVATTANNVAEGVSKVNSLSSATAKGIDTAATVVHTTATASSTIATLAWNVAKAIGKALLGDFTGLLIVGAGALATYAIATSGSSDETEKLNTSTKNASNTFATTYASSLADTLSKYQQLRFEYINLKTEHLRVEWIKENQTEFNNLGISVNSVNDAENVFINNTSDMIEALTLRAKAAAAKEVAKEHYKKAIEELLLLDDSNDKLTKKKLAEDVREGMKDALHGNVHKVKKKRYKSTGKWSKLKEKNIAEETKKGDEAMQIAILSEAEADKILGKNGKSNGRTTPPSTSRHTSSSNTPPSTSSNTEDTEDKEDEEVVPEGSIKDLKNKISKLKAKIEVTTDPHTLFNLLKLIDDYLGKIKAMELPVKLLENIDKNGLSALGKLDNGINLNDLNVNIPKIKAQPLPKDWEEKWDKNNKLLNNIEAIEKLRDSLSDLGGVFGDISSLWANLALLFEEGADSSTLAGNGLTTLGLSLLALGGQGMAAKVGAVMAAIGLITLGFALAAASPSITSTGWGWLAFVGAGLAAVATTISTIKSFSNGGIIQGINTHGDMSLARVNAGEMILNGSQQKKLFDMLNSGGGVGNNIGGNVVFTISGSNLKGVLRNYDSKMNKIK